MLERVVESAASQVPALTVFGFVIGYVIRAFLLHLKTRDETFIKHLEARAVVEAKTSDDTNAVIRETNQTVRENSQIMGEVRATMRDVRDLIERFSRPPAPGGAPAGGLRGPGAREH